MEIILLALLFMIGISAGSFLNVVADRVPLSQSIISPPSHCFNCGHTLDWRDMVPVLSYLILRGKCRYCGAGFSPRSMIIEALTGLLFVMAWLRFGAGMQMLIVIVFAAVFEVVCITGLEEKKMPAAFYYFILALALLLAAIHPLTQAGAGLVESLMGLVAGILLAGLMWLLLKWRGHSQGIDNILVAAMIGASIGYPAVIVAFLVAIITGVVLAGIGLMVRKKMPSRIPFTGILGCIALIALYTWVGYLDKLWPFRIS